MSIAASRRMRSGNASHQPAAASAAPSRCGVSFSHLDMHVTQIQLDSLWRHSSVFKPVLQLVGRFNRNAVRQ